MNHLTEDQLLRHALNLPEENELAEIEQHLVQCQTCRSGYEKITSDMETIGSIEMDLPIPAPAVFPDIKTKYFNLWKIAAVFLTGIILGYSVSEFTRKERPPCVSAQYLNTQPQANIRSAIPAIDLTVN